MHYNDLIPYVGTFYGYQVTEELQIEYSLLKYNKQVNNYITYIEDKF